jgi:hypothetical protein
MKKLLGYWMMQKFEVSLLNCLYHESPPGGTARAMAVRGRRITSFNVAGLCTASLLWSMIRRNFFLRGAVSPHARLSRMTAFDCLGYDSRRQWK